MNETDWKDLDAWLHNQQDQSVSAFSIRVALRTFPILFRLRYRADADQIGCLYAARALITEQLSVPFRDPRTLRATQRAISVLGKLALSNGAPATQGALNAIIHSCSPLTATSQAERRLHARRSMQASIRAFRRFAGNLEGLISKEALADRYKIDNSSPVQDTPLFRSSDNARLLLEWTEFPNSGSSTAFDPWSFWSRWYERAMAGDPLPWDLQYEIALIPDEIWDAGPEAVAEQIAGIEADYLARTTRLAEDVVLDKATGTFSVTPRPIENAPLISALLSRTEDALDDALQGNNGLREDMRAVRTLRRTHLRYGNDPQRIELDYTSVAISLRREIRETRELADTEDNLALLEAVEEGALALRAHHPEIAENRERIAKQRLREMGDEDRAVLEEARPLLVALSSGEMAEDFERDIPQLLNYAVTPVPSGAPPVPAVDESMRIFHRVPLMKKIIDDLSDKGASLFDSPQVKAIRMGLLAKDIAWLFTKLVEIGLKLFGVL